MCLSTFKVGNYTVRQIAIWETGGAEVLDLTASVSAPHVFIGKVIINGAEASVGTAITAYIYGVVRGSTTVQVGGAYTLLVNQGGGSVITFKIGNLTAHQTDSWKAGGGTVLDLSASG